VKLPAIISDNMVLQQNETIRIWGWANPGEKIEVRLDLQTIKTNTKQDSLWQVELAPISPNKTYELTVTGDNELKVKNILAGEVWVCGGQSNMRWHVKDSDGAEDALDYADFPDIRLFTVKPQATATPQKDCDGEWTIVSPNEKELANFSAVGYFFGRKLHRTLGLPVGLIDNSWGGTPIEAWMSEIAMKANPDFKFYLDQRDDWLANLHDNQEKFDREKMEPWKKLEKEAKERGETPPIKPRVQNWLRPQRLPSYLYNGMVVPIAPFVIKGVIWYQGESNVGKPHVYRSMFETLIPDWRKAWNVGQFPFYYAQLSMRQTETPIEPEYSDYGFLREAQTNVMALPNTGMAVTIDIGSVGTIHPPNKLDVGLRLARWALKNNYGFSDIKASGPLYKSMKINGNEIIINFDENIKGLVIKSGELKQIAIAGEDKKFVWAKAKLRGNKLVVWSNDIENPVAVRYAWADVPVGANLYGKNGLPAAPFRTDNWNE
jgi:sialate O-acetylesterase